MISWHFLFNSGVKIAAHTRARKTQHGRTEVRETHARRERRNRGGEHTVQMMLSVLLYVPVSDFLRIMNFCTKTILSQLHHGERGVRTRRRLQLRRERAGK